MAEKVAAARSKRSAASPPGAVALFTHTASRDDRPVVTLYGFGNDALDGVTVVAAVWPIYANDGSEPERQFHVFPTREKAAQFADETLTALEYVGCSIS